MKNAVIEMYEHEVNSMRNLLFELKPNWVRPRESVDKAIQRCLGIAQFVQTCPNGLKYEEIEPLYEKTRHELEALLEGD